MKFITILTFLTTLLLSNEQWLNLDSGKLENINKYNSLKKKYFGSDIVVFGEKEQRVFKKLERVEGSFYGKVFRLIKDIEIPAEEAYVELSLKGDSSQKYKTETDKNGFVKIENIPLGNYLLKIEKNSESFFGEVIINSFFSEKKFFIKEDANYYIKNNTFLVSANKTLEEEINIEIVNSSKVDERICIDLELDKKAVRNYWSDNKCFYLGSRKSISLPIRLIFNRLDSTVDGTKITLSLESKKEKWSFPLFLKFNYTKSDVTLESKSKDLKGYLIYPSGEIKKINNGSKIVNNEEREYKIILFSKEKIKDFQIDLGFDKKISEKTSLKRDRNSPFKLNRSLETSFGNIKEYSFKTIKTISLDEDSKSFTKKLNETDIVSAKIHNPKIAGISYSGNRLQITPKKDAFGSSIISLFSKDKYGNYYTKKEFYLVINPMNDEPVIIFEPNKEVGQGESYNYSFKAFDVDGEPLKKEVLLKPYWLDYNEKTGELKGVAATLKREYVTLAVSDAFTTVKKSFYIDVVRGKVVETKVEKEPKGKPVVTPKVTKTPVVVEKIEEPIVLDIKPKVEKVVKKEKEIVVIPEEKIVVENTLNSEESLYILKNYSNIRFSPNGGKFGSSWPKGRLIKAVKAQKDNWFIVKGYLSSNGWIDMNRDLYIYQSNLLDKEVKRFKTVADIFVLSDLDDSSVFHWKEQKEVIGFEENGFIVLNKSLESGKWITYSKGYRVKTSNVEVIGNN